MTNRTLFKNMNKPSPSIDLVTFDLDNTLWDVTQTIMAAEKLLRSWMAEHTPAALGIYASEQVGVIRQRILDTYAEKRHDLSFLRTEVLRHCMMEADMTPADAEENAIQAFEIFFAARNDVAFYPNAIKTLEILSQRYALYALTNGNANIDRVGIGRFFSGAVSSADVGASKPDNQMFTAVLTKARVAPERAVHIGDHLSDDIFGANRAGMRSIWFNHEGQGTNDTDHQPTAEARELVQRPDIIARLNVSHASIG